LVKKQFPQAGENRLRASIGCEKRRSADLLEARMEKMKSWLRVWREAMVYERDFKDRGLDNVKLQVLHANFAPERENAARRWIRSPRDVLSAHRRLHFDHRPVCQHGRNLFQKMRAGLKHKLGLTVTFRDQMHRVPDFLAPKLTDIAYYAWIDNYCAQNPLNPLIQAVFLLKKELLSRVPSR
jgi:hypothetical protein